MKIAIQGHPTRGKEIIQILRSLGATSYGTYDTCSHPEWYWYINKNREITCDPKSSMWGYKLYTLEEFEKEYPFKIGDIAISKTTNLIVTIVRLIENGFYFIRYNDRSMACLPAKNIKPLEMERNVTLTLEKAKEWYKKGGELKEVALQAYSEEELTKKELPKTWGEFCKNYQIKPGETFIDGYARFIARNSGTKDPIHDKNNCPSIKSAEAHLAMIQLEQLRDCWRQGWEPEWNDCKKYVIKRDRNDLVVFTAILIHSFLAFPTREMAEEFLKCFKDLIEKAGDLI